VRRSFAERYGFTTADVVCDRTRRLLLLERVCLRGKLKQMTIGWFEIDLH
jgi:hypothetical protein